MTAWSYSALTAFETCPRRYKLTRITREVVEPQTESTLHGNAVHRAMERAIKGTEPMPAKYDAYRPLALRCAQATGEKLVEFKFAVTSSLKPTTYFGTDVWCRGVIDFAAVRDERAVMIDWKTGKPKPDTDQLKLFAAALFAHRPRLQTATTGFVWLAYDRVDTDTYTRGEATAIWQEFLPRVQRMRAAELEDNYPPVPSGLCKQHCPVRRHQCEFSGRT